MNHWKIKHYKIKHWNIKHYKMNSYKISHYKMNHYKIKHYKIKHPKINRDKTSHYKNEPLWNKPFQNKPLQNRTARAPFLGHNTCKAMPCTGSSCRTRDQWCDLTEFSWIHEGLCWAARGCITRDGPARSRRIHHLQGTKCQFICSVGVLTSFCFLPRGTLSSWPRVGYKKLYCLKSVFDLI